MIWAHMLTYITGTLDQELLVTPAYERGAQLSPDRRCLLYQSNEPGQPEIYVRHCLAKTSYTCKMNDLGQSWIRTLPI
jgi:hypothetical protein